MYYVYVLFSQKDKRLYIGFTSDLRVRLKKHQAGFVRATKNRRPLTLLHYESFRNERDAKRRETFLKGGKGHQEMKLLLECEFQNIGYPFR